MSSDTQTEAERDANAIGISAKKYTELVQAAHKLERLRSSEAIDWNRYEEWEADQLKESK